VVLHNNDRQMVQLVTSNQHNLLEMLHNLMSGQVEMAKVLQRQQAGEHIVEPLMEIGQNVSICCYTFMVGSWLTGQSL
jgi:hypothetical protein